MDSTYGGAFFSRTLALNFGVGYPALARSLQPRILRHLLRGHHRNAPARSILLTRHRCTRCSVPFNPRDIQQSNLQFLAPESVNLTLSQISKRRPCLCVAKFSMAYKSCVWEITAIRKLVGTSWRGQVAQRSMKILFLPNKNSNVDNILFFFFSLSETILYTQFLNTKKFSNTTTKFLHFKVHLFVACEIFVKT